MWRFLVVAVLVGGLMGAVGTIVAKTRAKNDACSQLLVRCATVEAGEQVPVAAAVLCMQIKMRATVGQGEPGWCEEFVSVADEMLGDGGGLRSRQALHSVSR